MTALYILGGIILFFTVLLSVHLGVELECSEEKSTAFVKWLFIKIPVYDSTQPKKKKKKDKKKDTGKNTENTDNKNSADGKSENVNENELPEEKEITDETNKPETKTKTKKEKKPGNGLLKQLYLDLGYDGIEKMLFALCNSLNGFIGKLYKTVTIDDLYIEMFVTGGDSADTAIKYGKLSSWLFPTLGKVISTCKVKKYNFNIQPDFLGKKKKGYLYTKLHVTPLTVLNAAIVLGVQLLFKVLIKILFSNSKSKKSRQQPANVKTPGSAQKQQPDKK